MNKKIYFAVILAIAVLGLSGSQAFHGQTPAKLAPLKDSQLAQGPVNLSLVGNPAAIYCADIMGYRYSVVNDGAGGQIGVCLMPDDQACDQWDFYAGRCGQNYSYCARQGYITAARHDGQDPYSPDYAVCLSTQNQKVGTVAELSNLANLTTGQCHGTCATQPVDQNGEPKTSTPPAPSTLSSQATAPAALDWRGYQGQNWLTGVKNQANCGSCWAFAAVGVVEAYYNIAQSNPNLDLDLAEEDLVRCSGVGGCAGGPSNSALQYIKDTGIVDEACHPYTASDGSCYRCADWSTRLTSIEAYQWFAPNQANLKEAITRYGPVVTYLGVGDNYGGDFDGNGVYRCSTDVGINHAVVFVGYNDAGGYWIVRNSWSATWNGDGYFRVGYGECGIDSTFAAYVYKRSQLYLPLIARNFVGNTGITNGNFESGANGWTQYSTHGWALILNSGFPGSVTPHSSSWATWLGGEDDEISYIQQQVTVPPANPYLAYWHWIASNDACGYDFGGVVINGTVVDVYNLCTDTSTGGWVKHVVNLGAYAGQSVSLQIRSETDGSENSNLFVDDVVFQSSPTALRGESVTFDPQTALPKSPQSAQPASADTPIRVFPVRTP